jgi:hypothetical protein
MERVLAQLVTIMQEITNECKKGNVTLCEHATSHMKVLTCNTRNICLTKANEVLHPGLVGKNTHMCSNFGKLDSLFKVLFQSS